jgi:hypothetical protein
MCEHKILSQDEFRVLQNHKPYAINHTQQQKQKLKLLNSVITAYGDKYYRLKEGTRQAIEMICWFAAEKGYCFASDDYFSERFNVTSKTIRNIFKFFRDSELVQTVYRRSATQNGLGAPIHLFVNYPYFEKWSELLNLVDFQAYFQAKNAETPCESKLEQSKKNSTKYLSFNKNLFKILRKKVRLDETFTPKNVPDSFISAVKPFIRDAKEIYTLWGKVLMAYKQFSFVNPVVFYVDTTIDAFKQTVFAHKQRKIQKDFKGYFYGTLKKMFTYQKREEVFGNHPLYFNWLENKNDSEIRFKKSDELWKREVAALIIKEEQMHSFSIKEIPY